MGSLVGYAPDDYVGAVLVAAYHIGKLALGIGVGIGIGPGNCPIDRNLGPYQDAHLLGFTYHILVVGVVGQTYVVAAQFPGPGEQGAGIVNAVGAASAVGLLVMDANTFQEYGLAVQQQLLALGLDGAETYPVLEGLIGQGNLHIVEFGVIG